VSQKFIEDLFHAAENKWIMEMPSEVFAQSESEKYQLIGEGHYKRMYQWHQIKRETETPRGCY